MVTIASAATVPLPRPRPPELGPAPAVPLPPLRPAIPPERAEPAAPPAPSACQLRLPDIATVEIIPPVIGQNGCGVEDAVKMSAITLKDGARIAVDPAAVLRCSTAEAIATWVREDVGPIAAAELGGSLKAVANFDSYECRGRNRVAGAKMSEHGKGNAIDIRALTLTNGKSYELTDIAVSKSVRERLKASACTRFTTVLGPESDGYHENHIHVDLAERRGGYRICQWAVRDVNDVIPVPRERPAEAPPRELDEEEPEPQSKK